MITKGTAEYKKAQEFANEIFNMASKQRWNDNTLFNVYFNRFYNMMQDIMKLNVFASQIAKTIYDACDPRAFKVANCSSKQAWILACAVIEAGMSTDIMDY